MRLRRCSTRWLAGWLIGVMFATQLVTVVHACAVPAMAPAAEPAPPALLPAALDGSPLAGLPRQTALRAADWLAGAPPPGAALLYLRLQVLRC